MGKKTRIKNKKKFHEKAIALRYNQDREASPRVIAKGEGYIAQQIRSIAEKNNIPIRQDTDLVELLSQVDIDKEIPPELYTAIAEILRWIYRANTEMSGEK